MRPVLLPTGYVVLKGFWASMNVNVSDSPGTVDYTADPTNVSVSAAYETQPSLPDRQTYTFLHFGYGPISPGAPATVTESDGTFVASGKPVGVYLGASTSLGGSISVVTADTFNVYAVQDDFNPVTLCWSNQPALGTYPVLKTVGAGIQFGDSVTGIWIPITAMCYGLAFTQMTSPGTSGIFSLQNGWQYPAGLVLQT